MSALPPLAQALLAGAVDYAGLFPPAELGMAEAVANYARYRGSPENWALGRLVVPVARLEELAAALPEAPVGAPWWIAATAAGEPSAEAAAIAGFNAGQRGRAQVDVVEARTASAEEVSARLAAHAGLVCYCELDASAGDFEALVSAVQAGGGRAKLRAGGVRAEMIPEPATVLRFLTACHHHGLMYKATAGLHHAVRGEHALSHAADATKAMMHGYLNLMLAAVAVEGNAASATGAKLLLRQDDPHIEPDAVVWGSFRCALDQIEALRRRFVGFGSCSFTEPLEDLARIAGSAPEAARI